MSEPVALTRYFWLSRIALLSWLYVRQHYCYEAQAWGPSGAAGAGTARPPESPFPGELGHRAARQLHRHVQAPAAGPGRSGKDAEPGSRSRGQPVGAVPGGGGGAEAAAGPRQRPPPRCRPAPPGRGHRAPPGTGAGGTGRGGRGPARRDLPRPLLPAGEALKHPGEARSPALGSPDARAAATSRAEPSREPLRCSRRHAGYREAVGVGADFRPVAAGLPGDAGRGVPLQTGQSRRGCSRRGHGQILLGAEALHQPHHQAEIWKEIKPRYTDLRPLVEGKHRKHS